MFLLIHITKYVRKLRFVPSIQENTSYIEILYIDTERNYFFICDYRPPTLTTKGNKLCLWICMLIFFIFTTHSSHCCFLGQQHEILLFSTWFPPPPFIRSLITLTVCQHHWKFFPISSLVYEHCEVRDAASVICALIFIRVRSRTEASSCTHLFSFMFAVSSFPRPNESLLD
jgi:hypothetical protein